MLDGRQRPFARRFLLLSILIKYLEDRRVFPHGWFSSFQKDASAFSELLKLDDIVPVKKMLNALKEKFNGDIFDFPDGELQEFEDIRTQIDLLLNAKGTHGQLYL